MTYDELLAMSRRAVNAGPDTAESMLDVVQILAQHAPASRAIAAEKIAMLMSEFIEEVGQQGLRSVKH